MGQNSECKLCKSSLSKNEIGLCKKLLDEKGRQLFCITCLAEHLETTIVELNEKIIDFKEQGCPLFS